MTANQAIKDLRSLIGDHDLDHFFHDRELIAITFLLSIFYTLDHDHSFNMRVWHDGQGLSF